MADETETRLREIAAEYDCLIEPDAKLATGYTDNTLAAKRKQRRIAYVWIGKNRFYPKAQFAKPETVRERIAVSAKAML